MRDPAILLACLVAWALSLGSPVLAAPRPARLPNVVLVFCDDLG